MVKPPLAGVRGVDFISLPAGTSRRAAWRSGRSIAIRLFDPLEMEMPDLGVILMQDAETGEQIYVDTHDKAFRKRFAAAAAKNARRHCAKACATPASTPRARNRR